MAQKRIKEFNEDFDVVHVSNLDLGSAFILAGVYDLVYKRVCVCVCVCVCVSVCVCVYVYMCVCVHIKWVDTGCCVSFRPRLRSVLLKDVLKDDVHM